MLSSSATTLVTPTECRHALTHTKLSRQTLRGDFSHQNKNKVPLEKFQNMCSFGATGAQNYGGMSQITS